MNLSFSDCTEIGQIIVALWGLVFTTFVLSVIVIGNNTRDDYEPTKIEALFDFFVPFVFKRELVKERIIGWYMPYKISGILVIPLSLLLFGGAYSGTLCTPS